MDNTQLPAEVTEKILRARDALALNDIDEAYHQLYGIASPNYDSYFPWKAMEDQIDYPKVNEQQYNERRQVTEYAAKLHQVEQDKERLNDQNQRLHEKNKTLSEHYRTLQSKCDRYEALLQLVLAKAKEGIFPHLPVETMGARKCIEVDTILTEALSAGEGEKEEG